MRAKEMSNCHQFFSTNKQYLKIKLMQNETNRWSIFLVKDKILVKLRIKGLNYHNFHIFYHFYQYLAFTKKYSTDLSHFASV